MSSSKSGSGRVSVLVALCVVILGSFGVHYGMQGLCDGSDPMRDYFIQSFAPQLGNSLIVFTLLWWFGWPMVQKHVAERKKTIEKEIDESCRQKEAASAAAKEAASKIADLDYEKRDMAKNYELATHQECRRIRTEAEKNAERLVVEGNVSFEHQANVARRAFEGEVMAKSIERAREDIAKKIANDPALRDALIERSIDSFELGRGLP